MKKIFLFASLTLLAFSLTACWEFNFITGSGEVDTYDVSIPEKYSKVEILGEGKVYINKGEQKDAIVKIDENLYPHLEMYVSNGTLIIDLNNAMPTRFEVYLQIPEIEGVDIAGSGDVFVEGDFDSNSDFESNISGSGDLYVKEINAEDVEINISGSGDVKFYGTMKNLTSTTSGSGDIQVIGKGENVEISIAGSGNVNLSNAEFSNGVVTIAGSGNVKLDIVKSLNLSIYGSGDIYLYSKPENFKYQIAGTGKIIYVR